MVPYRIQTELPLILASLFIAFVVWLIAEQGLLDRDWVSVGLQVEHVPPMMQVEVRPAEVSVNMQYPRSLNNRIVSRNFSYVIDAGSVFSSDPETWSPRETQRRVTYKIDLDRIQKRGLSRSVQPLSVDPAKVTLLARLRTARVQVEVVTEGTLPSNLELAAPLRPEPEELTVAGSAEALDQLAEAGNVLRTRPVNLSDIRSSGQLRPELMVPDGITLLGHPDQRILVDVGVLEHRVQRIISDVPVELATFREGLRPKIEPPVVDVMVEGPSSALYALDAADFTFQATSALHEGAGRKQEVGLEVRLKSRVDAGIARQVRLLECRPPRVTVEFAATQRENGSTTGPSGLPE